MEEEFSSADKCTIPNMDVIFCAGDLNAKLLNNISKLNMLLKSYGLSQIVKFVTRVSRYFDILNPHIVTYREIYK